jgi:predicted MPP superfamily phosphohydrolase
VPKTFVGYNIAHVSDIHNSSIGVVNAVSRSNPDIILVTGGFTDDNGNYKNSVKILEKLSKIAPTYFVLGDNDSEYVDSILSSIDSGPIYLADNGIDIQAPEVDESAFINKYIGKGIVSKANNGDEDSLAYIEYTKKSLAEDSTAAIKISGLSFKSGLDGLIDETYSIIGTDKSQFQIMMANQVVLFDTLAKTDLDIVFSGQTHGSEMFGTFYKKGAYSASGTTLFLSGGIGNLDSYSSRIFNYPEITSITLSDGTIKQENPLERVLEYFMPEVKTKFDNDGGFKNYTYTYGGVTDQFSN